MLMESIHAFDITRMRSILAARFRVDRASLVFDFQSILAVNYNEFTRYLDITYIVDLFDSFHDILNLGRMKDHGKTILATSPNKFKRITIPQYNVELLMIDAA